MLALDFAATSGGPTVNLISDQSGLVMSGGELRVTGGPGETNSQTFDGLTITGGNNIIRANGTAADLTLNLGAITRTAGLANFVLPGTGAITTSNADGALGGWATVNGTDYAKVEGGNIIAFTDADYVNRDDASTWEANQILSDAGGSANTAYFGIVGSSVRIGGLQYTANAGSTVEIGAAATLGIDGTIIVAPTVASGTQRIINGSITGTSGGGVLGVQQNGAGTFEIASQIVDNTGVIGFTKAGAGKVVLSGSSTYTGATTVAQGTLSVNSIENGGTASAIGRSTSAASNLVIQGATLEYTGGTTISDRGFTLTRSGATTSGTISVLDAAANLTFGGLVTSPDGAGLTKIGDGTLTLTNAGNNYTGITTISDGTLAISSIGNGGGPSTLGASSSASANLVLQSGGELEYTGGTASTNRGFTLGTGGGAIDVTTSGTELTISGTMVGALAGQTLTKNGAGTLILAGTNTGFAAGGVVNAGTLRAGSAQAFGTGSWTVASGGVLDLADRSNGIGALNGSGNVTLGSLATTTLTIGGANSTSTGFTGTISGAGNVTHTNGTQVMTGCGNSYTGVTTITGALGGSVLTTDCIRDGGESSGIGASGSDAGNLVLQNSGILNYTAVATNQVTDRGFTLAAGFGYIQVADAGTVLEFTGDFTGPGALIKRGAGTLVLSGANGSTGETRVEAGVLRSGSDTSFNNGRRLLMSNVAGALFDLNGFDATFGALDGGGALGGNIALGDATLTLVSIENRTYSGTISGSGSLVKTGTENQGLANCGNSYTGSTTISNGTLFVSCLADGLTNSSIGASAAGASNLVLNGGNLTYNGTGDTTNRLFTLGAGSASKISSSGTGALTFSNTGAIAYSSPGSAQTIRLGGTNTSNNSFALQITDNSGGQTSFTKEDAGTWILTNNDSTYTGVTTIAGGVLGVDKLADGGEASSIGRSTNEASKLVIGSGSTLRYTGAGDSTDRLFTLQAGVTFIESSGTGAIAFTNTGTMGFQGNGARVFALGGTNSGVNVMGVSITDGTGGATTLAKNDTGNWYLTGNSTYSGDTNINAGTLFIGNGGNSGSITSAVVNVTGLGALGFNRADTVTYAGLIRGSGGVTQAGTGTTILTGTNTYTGGTTISAGTLQLGNGGATGSIVGNVANSGTLAFNRSDAYTFAGTITGGTGTIAQIGSGTTTLTAANIARTTRVGAGTLNVNGALTTQNIAMAGTSTLNVNAATGALLGGTASLTGDAGASTINVAGGATLRAAGDLGDGGDTVNLTGTLATGGSVLNLGLGDDSLVLNDSALIDGARIDGGGGLDDVRVVAISTRTLDSGAITDFESLTKQGTGTLVLTGAHDFSSGVTIEAGRLTIGSGSAAGSITGDIQNDGEVNFQNLLTQTYGGTITGTGRLMKEGAGTLVLTGDNSYTGVTDIYGGTLIVNGDQSAATGRLTVRGSSTLAGAGIIGGDVILGFNGMIAPGDGSGIPGTLTILGDLAIGAASTLRFDFGAAGEVGGDLNDLIVVGGDLTLDGTLNVTQSPGGTFGPGVYRIISYGGALTNNGLNVGSPDHFIQTSIAGQVNLVNSAGLALSFWDGDGGARADGLVNGGSGTWRAAGDQNWTDDSGTFVGPFASASFAVFQGAAGLVQVDATNGPVEAMGMQFASDGYIVDGDAITLVDDPGQAGLQSTIRVGDGTAAGAGYVARIDSVLGGTTRLVKTDAGTLVLTGTNLYTGGTAINGGTLRISSNGNLGEFTGGLSFDGGTLHVVADVGMIRDIELVGDGTIDADAAFVELRGVISGGGALTKEGNGTLALLANNSYTGGTTIAEGILQIGNGGTTGSILGDVVNNGSLLFARSDNVIVGGTISGSGELIQGWTGILTLTADNSYTGGTTIRDGVAGTLQLGNGGTTGSIVGDVVNGGTLIFNRSNDYSFAGTISGTGSVRHEGTGTTILTADNSYTGSTIISFGTLLINGNQTAAVGTTYALGGGTLGGTGTIGGDVFVGGGATLTPGDATGPGTLTINGNLGFSPNAVLAYEFGQSNVIGGPLNDLTEVAGDLTLDGRIDVTVTPGGSFGPGLYRVISYGGVLAGPGLAIGTTPGGSIVGVQTSIDGQVNLVNAAGGTFNFWDGAAPANESNNSVDGGDGIWQNSSGNNDWTPTDGAVSGAYSDGTFAIFAAAAGTVEIDNSLGAVTASGLQFASDGYTITGQNLTLVGPESVIRVGDGTAAGLGMTATIDTRIFGATQVVKADLGTLVLTRSNTHSGGTRIDAGTIRISSDTQLGDAAGALSLNGGTLNTSVSTASGRSVNLLGAGTLLTDAGTSLTLFGSVSGTGGFTKAGAGILMLTGTNSFGGDVDVTAGSLFVNGDQSAATGATRVASGAALAGSGIIGGNVALADGATLDPGGTLFGVGTLTINGDLALSSGSALAFQFGEANAEGGTLNDLVNVGGDLTLDGTINVSVPAGGSFGPGIYRVFNYGGALIDNGLTLGTMPGGSAVSVQTAVAGQVNLVNTAGLMLSFWDGAAGPKNNDTVEGGDGVWRIGGGSNNWTDMNGDINADYAQDSFAIFTGAAGRVTVDNSGGDVLATGLQFASDGYVVAGGPLTLTGGQAIVQVGDGSVAGAGFTATIEAELTGTAALRKVDAGRLVLTGANSYTGGTWIEGGTLQIGDGGTTGSVTGNIANDGALVVDRAGTLVLDGAIGGSGSLTKLGSGVLALTGANSYLGGTTIDGGTVQVSSDANLGDVSGTLALQGGTLQAAASFISNRAITLGSPDVNTIDTQGFDVTLAGTIGDGANNSGGNFLNKIGSGTLTLTGVNSYGNRTVIAGGTLALAGAGTIGTRDLIVSTGAVFDISQTDVGARVIQLNSGPAGTIALGSKTLTLGNSGSFGDWSGTITDGGIGGGIGGSVVITGFGGSVRFLEANSYTGGTTVEAGTLELVGNGSLYSAGAVTVNGGAVFAIEGLAGAGTTIGDLSGAGSVALGDKSLTFGTGSDTLFSGAILGNGGALVKAGTGTFTLTGTASHTGGTTISAGMLQIGDGGTDGSLAGDVVNEGELAFNRSDLLAFGGTISGSGSVYQTGSGTTVLTGANSHTGVTSVWNGTLLIDGDQSLATGPTIALGGGTLGGMGTIGGDVSVGGGAVLAPGSNGVGTLTINGNLDFSPNAVLAFEFGEANVPGGLLNDLVNVGGDLVLGGTINVTEPAGGSFGPGVYRIINYAGTLTDNGLVVGSLPGGAAFVQTAVANQVNLVNTAGLALNFWDGPTGARNDGTIQGGDGTWRIGGGANDWTEVNGDINADYTQDSFAIFQGAAGTVTVDNAGGDVRAAGLQFTTDGYVIDGGPLTLAGAQATIRVGDGSASDAGLTATIEAALAGSAQLVKTDGGTLVLAGTNLYTGGTAINGGVLQVSSDANLGAAAGGLSLDGGTLHTTGLVDSSRAVELAGAGTFLTDAAGTLTLRGVVSGAGALTKDGVGTLVLAADNLHSGGTTIARGELRLGNGSTAGSLTGDVINNGLLAFDRSNVLELTGTISGSGAVNQLGTGTTILAADNSHSGGTTIAAGTLQLGNGGTTGSILGDVVNDGTLAFHRSNALTFAGFVSGSGGVSQIGTGTTILTGANSYAGATNVTAGTLLVNGDQSLATGLTSVASGATLGGSGTIGGSVNVADGGMLAAGSGGVGLLTINGDLALAATSQLVFEFGEANVPGGPLNDLVELGGNLVLDGTINVTEPAGGSFGPGVYRIINYAGTLTDNGLVVGSLPGGAAFVQTAVANQVNLVNTAGLTLNFWDGAAGRKNDGAIQGGAGIWRLGGGENNWTEVNGAINADYAQDSFAIFQGTGGTVTVDNAGGNVSAAGMQFTGDGYRIAGSPLTLTGAQAFVRVGDGSAGDAGITATIASALIGSAQLVKDMGGTLVLTGTNSYTGGTAINGGTLSVSSDANLGDATGGLSFDGGTLNITTTFESSRAVNLVGTGTFLTQGTGFVLRGPVSGGGALVKDGNGLLTLTADNSYTGGTTIAAGTLRLGAGGTTGSILGNIVNNARFAIDRSDTLTLTGTISGNGELLQGGAGTTILTATNSYTGATRVSAGTLLINGDQSAATGVTSVAANGTLGGTGTIGGDVQLGNGTLAPGAGGAGTLTINGDLSMVAGSRLAVDFGASNAVGSPLNDVVNVGGDLVLDGTLNVAVTPGGAFDIGLYRVANYGGTLTDNGLAIGSVPAGADLFVQTSVAGQVNLINVGAATLNFWDGAAGPKFNGAVDGGAGTWQSGAGNENWADATGAVNAGYADGGFAIFTGTAGTVTIDDSLGAVTASGLQFATGGYTIAGDALTLTGPDAVIRVGDGTAGGAAYTATIGSELTGATQLVKTDLGTLVLTGTNSYTGGTRIEAGLVRISSDANLGAAGGDLTLAGGGLHTVGNVSSARDLVVAGSGLLLTDGGTTLTLTGAVSGAGSLVKNGTGTLVLAGTGTHSGGINVGAGTLLVEGDYSAATGAVILASGTTFGGGGTIGGDVSLDDGAVLSPGSSVGTLTINGDLSLVAGTRLAFELGEANVAGGSLNDLVEVGGDLVLDGILDVTVPVGGAFEAGVYRLFNYGGTLTNNGLSLGTLPAGSDGAVQTSIAGQVNLVNSAGLSLAFWDGAAGPKNNGEIEGGSGVWQSGPDSDNWTNAGGTVNGAYGDGAFAVFGGTGGTVTIDDAAGQVTASGLQFAADGYTLTGDRLALTGPQSTVRVGDGTEDGAEFTATVNAAISGDTQLVKTDAGTLVLGGANLYTGGTAINGGTVQISADANLGASTGNVTINGGTLATSATLTSNRTINLAGPGTISTAGDTTFTLAGLLSGTGALTKAGAGTLLLTGDNAGFTGSTRVTGGMLAITGTLGGSVSVDDEGRFGGTGTAGDVTNAGIVAPGMDGIGTLTVGAYAGAGGTLEIEAVLGGDASASDRLVVAGGTSGETRVVVTNRGGLGAQTVEGIKIVDVTGGASSGTFALEGDYVFEGRQAVIAGAYGYRLYQGGVSTPADGDWYLRSARLDGAGNPVGPLYQPGVPLYEGYAETLQMLNGLPTLQERAGNRQYSGFTASGIGLWGRMEATRHRPEAAVSTSGTDINASSWTLQAGLDAPVIDRNEGLLVAGMNVRYGKVDSQVRSVFGSGNLETQGYSLGATLTWYGSGGFYADAQAQMSFYYSDLDSSVLGSLVEDNDGTGEAFSLEVGQRLPLGGGLSVTPQAQIVYSDVRFDRFVDPNDASVGSAEAESLRGRLGLSLDHQHSWQRSSGDTTRTHLYGIVNLDYEMLDGTRVDVSGTPLLRRGERLWGEVGVGGSLSWKDGRYAIFTELSAETAVSNFGDSNNLRANAGFRMQF